jgi:hypothetical protein
MLAALGMLVAVLRVVDIEKLVVLGRHFEFAQ